MSTKIKYLLTIICSLSFIVVSCSKMETNEGEVKDLSPQEFDLSIALGGEIVDVNYSPLTKAYSPADSTLYVVSVWYCDSTSTPTTSSTKYAHGVFNDISKCKLKVLTGKKYCIRIKAIIGGEANFHHYRVKDTDTCYFYKDQGSLRNQLIYNSVDNSEENYYGKTEYGTAYYKDGGSSNDPKMQTYYGGCVISPTSSVSVVPIDLYYCCYQLNIKAVGLKETDNSLYISYNLPGGASIPKYLSYNAPEWSSGIRTFYSLEGLLYNVHKGGDYWYYSNFNASYSVKIDGVSYSTNIAYDKKVYLGRKRVTNVTLTVDHDKISSNIKSCNLTFEDMDFLPETEDYDFSGTIKE